MPKKTASGKRNSIRKFFSLLGPGLITGAADDDPSGIATYSIAGAQMGTAMLWTALITWPFRHRRISHRANTKQQRQTLRKQDL